MDGELREFDDLESRLKELIGAELKIDISDLEPCFRHTPDFVLQSYTKATIQLKLEGILRNDINLGLAVIGRTSLSYWAIGTHTPHGYISRITDTNGNVVYKNDNPYDFSRPSWGIAGIKISDYREHIGWQQVDDPPNHFLQNYHPHIHFHAIPVPISVIGYSFTEGIVKIGTQIFYLPGKIFDYVVSLLRVS